MYLGFDLGTSGVRVILTDSAGGMIASSARAYDNPHPQPGWSEQDPADWIAAVTQAMAELRAEHPEQIAAVKGIGLSGQMHGATVLDAQDQVLRPCILWNDTRSAAQAAGLDATPGLREVSGNIVFPGFTAPKLMWLREMEPALFDKIAKVLLPKDYLRLWLTGDYISDMSDSAGTSWMDVGARDWSDTALAASGMRRDQMPELREGSAVAGHLRPALVQDWGMTGPVVVAGGGGDNAATACGAGCFTEGRGLVSLGTSGVLLAAKDSYAPKPDVAVHTFCHAVPDRWYQMGVILAATDSLNWLARSVGQKPADLAQALPDQIEGPGQALFLPYLSGERTPHNDAQVRGAFVGLDVASDTASLTQAVMEGVSYALRDSLEALKSTGTELTEVLATGGGAQSRFWLETLASTLDLPLCLPARGEYGAAMGAARLAMVAVTGDSPETIMTAPEVAEVIEPRADLVARYGVGYDRYRALYPALRADAARYSGDPA